VTPISIAPPASTNQDRRVVMHEPAPIETHVTIDIPATNTIAAEDIGHDENVRNDDEVLPQLTQDVLSSPVPTNSENVSIGDPPTPIVQDQFWDKQHPNTLLHEVIPCTPPAQVTTLVLETPQVTPEDMEKS
jgi:hypothetical protein